METDSDKIYSKHILEAIAAIESFTQGMSYAEFIGDLKTNLAVTRELEIIGEATKRLSEKFKDNHGQIPWRRIASMRDFLIHDYMKVDFQEVWNAATKDIIELKAALENDR